MQAVEVVIYSVGSLRAIPAAAAAVHCLATGFTAHPSAAVQAPGTYLGLIEKLDYLKELGVNAIELLPVSKETMNFS
jgi:1,4-alpha-glucan branching enzyme